MAIFRIEKTRDYTVMSNHHLKDRRMSLKSKGLLSLILSLPDEWNYSMFAPLFNWHGESFIIHTTEGTFTFDVTFQGAVATSNAVFTANHVEDEIILVTCVNGSPNQRFIIRAMQSGKTCRGHYHQAEGLTFCAVVHTTALLAHIIGTFR